MTEIEKLKYLISLRERAIGWHEVQSTLCSWALDHPDCAAAKEFLLGEIKTSKIMISHYVRENLEAKKLVAAYEAVDLEGVS